MKICSKCKENKNETDFYKDKRTKDGLYSNCKKCHNIIQEKNSKIVNKKWVVKNREYVNSWMKKYQQNPIPRIKQVCRIKTRCLILSGKFKKDVCKECGNKKVEGHHPDYNKPEQVIWLCIRHHKLLHKNKGNKSYKL